MTVLPQYTPKSDWVMPLLDEMVAEQKEKGTKWTPSRIIEKMGTFNRS